MPNIEPLMERNFLEYASYVIIDRAIPDLRDGCKPVQRRILQTLWEMDDGKFHKVANVIGETMKLHPHGDASIGDALVVLANAEYLIEKQGNFGNVITGHAAAAARYIECRLTKLARETLFNDHLTRYQPSYDGRKQEAIFLPAKLPLLLMLGVEGIAVGMATKILPHNFIELLQGQIAILRGENPQIHPDFPHGGVMDAAEYAEGRGKVRVRAVMSAVDDKRIIITEIPFGTTTEKLIASIEAAIGKGKVKISGIQDFTTDTVEIELTLPRGVYADEVMPQLYAYTDCEMSLSCNLLTIRDGHPHETTVGEVLRFLTEQLQATLKAELEWERQQLEDRRHWLTLEQLFIENRVYKRIEEAKTDEAVRAEVWTGMEPYTKLFIRAMEESDVDRLLEIRIRRISRFDINKHRKEIDDIVAAIAAIDRKLGRMKATTISYLEDLIKRYGKDYPRRTRIESFQVVDKREVARANLKLAYDPDTGFFGSAVKGDQFQMQVTEYDKILIVSRDGSYRVVQAPEKFLIPDKPLVVAPFDEANGHRFTVVYRDKKKNAFAKKVHIQSFIKGREYELIKDKDGKIDILHEGDLSAKLSLEFVPAKGQRLKEDTFDLASVEFGGVTIRGVRMAPKPVAKIKRDR